MFPCNNLADFLGLLQVWHTYHSNEHHTFKLLKNYSAPITPSWMKFFIFSDASLISISHSTATFLCCVLENAEKQTISVWKQHNGPHCPRDYIMIPATISLGSTLPFIGVGTKWDLTQRNTSQPLVVEFLYVAVNYLFLILRHQSHAVSNWTYSFLLTINML